MKANILPVPIDLSETLFARKPGAKTYKVIDYTLFMYGLVRGDIIVACHEGEPLFIDLAVYELDGNARAGLPIVETHGFLTRLAGLLTAGKIEFSVAPDERERLQTMGRIIGILRDGPAK